MANLRRWFPGFNREVALFFLHTGLFQAGVFGISDAILNFYFVSLGYGADTIGVFQGLPRLGGLLTGVPLGLLADRIGIKRITVLSVLGVMVVHVIMLLVPTTGVLTASRFLYGMFFGAGYIAATPLLVTLTERRYHTHLFAWHSLIAMVASAAGTALGGVLPGIVARAFPNMGGAQSPFAYGAALFGIVVLAVVSLVPLLRLAERPIPRRIRGNAPTEPIPWLRLTWLTSPYLLFGFTAGLTWPFYNLFFRHTFGVSDEVVGSILSVGWVCMGLVTLANPWLDRQVGRARGAAIMMTVASGAFVVLAVAANLWLGALAFIVAAAARNMFSPLFLPLLLENLPTALHNSASSASFVLWSLGWFVASTVAGQWQVIYGYDFIMRLVAVGMLLIAANILLIFRHERRAATINP